MNVTELTGSDLVSAYATGELSPVEVTQATLKRIAEIDGELNAYCLVDEDQAIQQAKSSEERWQRGEPHGPFDGVPTHLKDIFLTKGWPTLRGSKASDPDQEWLEDAPVPHTQRESGMVFLGKTTTPEIAWKAVTDSPLTGITRNPFDTSLTPGGSSGGTSAAVAAGMGPVAVGTDAGGSIRIPASFCGIVGLKPTLAQVPMYPASPFAPLAHAGPMTKTVKDAAILMDIIAVPDSRDPNALPAPRGKYRDALHKGITELSIAYSPDLGYVNVDPEVAEICDRAVKKMMDAGARVTEKDPGFSDPLDAFEIMWAAGASALLRAMKATPEILDPGLAKVWEYGETLSGVDYIESRTIGANLGILMGEFHKQHDLLITPTVAIPPFEAGRDVPADSDMERWPQWASFSIPFNMTGQPAISVPVGKTAAGLPVGLQIVGPRHRDDLVLAAGQLVESLT